MINTEIAGYMGIVTGRARLQEVVRCALYHSKGATNTFIAQTLGISGSRVRQNLEIAQERGILKVEAYPSPEMKTAERIMEEYGLKKVYVFPTYIEEENLEMLARRSAAFLEKLLDDDEGGICLFSTDSSYEEDLSGEVIPTGLHQEFKNNDIILSKIAKVSINGVDSKDNPIRWLINDTGREYIVRKADDDMMNIYRKIGHVAVGPGRTTLAFAKAISNVKRPNMRVGSTAIAAIREKTIASNTLIGILAGKWECELYRFKSGLPIKKKREYADVFVFGIDKLNIYWDTALVLQLETGVNMWRLELDFSKLRARGGTGFINYQAINASGKPLEWEKFYDKIFRGKLLELGDIKDIAANREKLVVCIAAGVDNAGAIRAGLLGKYFNVLITDYQTAMTILKIRSKKSN